MCSVPLSRASSRQSNTPELLARVVRVLIPQQRALSNNGATDSAKRENELTISCRGLCAQNMNEDNKRLVPLKVPGCCDPGQLWHYFQLRGQDKTGWLHSRSKCELRCCALSRFSYSRDGKLSSARPKAEPSQQRIDFLAASIVVFLLNYV